MADFKELIHGENTMIGDKGMTISGGQKQRISIARALYSQTDIVIFDDPLSAVDAHVSNKLFFEAVNGSLLKQRTRLFVTNQTQYLQHCDRVIYLKQGKIAAQGSPSEVISVMQADEAISALATSKADDDDDHESDMTDAKAVSNKAEAASTAASEAASAASPAVAPKAVLAPATPNKTNSPGSYDICDLFNYILRGWWFLALVLVLNLVIFLSLMGHQFSLALYSLHTFSSYNYGQFAAAFVGTFAIIGILAFVRSATVASLTGQCFNELHEQLLRRVFYSPMSFFETHSSGMILEWFGGNLGFLDKAASSLMDLAFATMFLFGLFMIMLVILYPWLLLAAVPVISVVIWLIRVYRPTNFQSTQLKLRTETPVVSHFSQTLAGLISIRAYAAQNVFVRDWFTKLDANGRADIGYVACGQWVTNFADLIGTLLIVGAGVLAVVARDTEVTGILGTSGGSGVAANGQLTLTAARAALSLFFGTWVCTVASRLINIQVSVGDIFSVTTKLRNLLSLPVERESSKQPPANWPSAGAVEIRGLVMRYRPELPPVLRSVSCSIKAGEKIGIVGRTGAGKSSFVTALFRLAEAEAGSQVEIDGVRIDDMNLQALRARLAIITQDPVCVQGSIRYNVDPMHKCQSDDDIWRALDIAQLSPFVRGLPAGLDHQIDSTGSNISLGQRQQLSMARALLHRPKLLIMDEASSSIDNHTDELIQTAMETACKCVPILLRCLDFFQISSLFRSGIALV
jgi:ATP-binding cassette subfamily C (CFTR/MRP) protein 1